MKFNHNNLRYMYETGGFIESYHTYLLRGLQYPIELSLLYHGSDTADPRDPSIPYLLVRLLSPCCQESIRKSNHCCSKCGEKWLRSLPSMEELWVANIKTQKDAAALGYSYPLIEGDDHLSEKMGEWLSRVEDELESAAIDCSYDFILEKNEFLNGVEIELQRKLEDQRKKMPPKKPLKVRFSEAVERMFR